MNTDDVESANTVHDHHDDDHSNVTIPLMPQPETQVSLITHV